MKDRKYDGAVVRNFRQMPIYSVAGAALTAGLAGSVRAASPFTNVSDRTGGQEEGLPGFNWGQSTNWTYFDNSWSSFPSGEVVFTVCDSNLEKPNHRTFKHSFSNCPMGQTVQSIGSFWTSNKPIAEAGYPQYTGYEAWNAKTDEVKPVISYGQNNTSNEAQISFFTEGGQECLTRCKANPHWNVSTGLFSNPYDYHIPANGTNTVQLVPESGLSSLLLTGALVFSKLRNGFRKKIK